MSLQCPLGKCQTPPIDTEAIKRDGWLEGPHKARHYTIDDLKAIKSEYVQKLKELREKEAA